MIAVVSDRQRCVAVSTTAGCCIGAISRLAIAVVDAAAAAVILFLCELEQMNKWASNTVHATFGSAVDNNSSTFASP